MHTPGPWTVDKYDRYDKDIFIFEPGVTVDNDDVDHDQAAANARLIAAAPELLLALQRLVNDSMFKDHPEASQMALDAIAKATGETP